MAYKRKSPMPEIEGGTNQLTYTTGDILYASAANTLSKLAVGSNTEVLTLAAGIPSWAAGGGGDVVGPASATDNALARFDGTTGKLLQNSTVIVTDAGEMTNASQPAFFAYNSATDTNQTGAGTVATVDFDTEVFDQGGDFATDTFTAPVTGRYFLASMVLTTSITSIMTSAQIRFTTSNREFSVAYNAATARSSGNNTGFEMATLADMDAADTAVVNLFIQNGAGDTAGIYGAAGPQTCFSGNLVC